MQEPHEDSEFVRHEPCPGCGSSDALARYSDGHAHCFAGCGHYERGDGTTSNVPQATGSAPRLELIGECRAIVSRGINKETAEKFGYRVGVYSGKPAHLAYYLTDARTPIAAKVRFPNKDFTFIGTPKEAGLYGQWLWREKGKMLVITEGEIDALTVSQLQSNKWPVVSIPTGADGAVKAIRKQLAWVEGFDKVIFMFDMDEPGREAALECAQLLTPGKAAIASLPLKDANEMLMAGRGSEVISAIWDAKDYRPDGIVFGSDITLDSLLAASSVGFEVPYPILNQKLGGLRKGELTLMTAGSGIGKSTLAREIAYHLHQAHGLTIGNVYLEESKEKTAQGYIAIHNNVSLGNLRRDKTIITPEAWAKSLREVVHTRMYFYDHFGSLDSDNLLAKLRFLAVSLECDFVILDHISIVVSGQDGSGDERKDIDRLMTKLRSLIEETGMGVIAIVHLSKPDGKAHEEGGRVTLSHLRGSGSLKQLSDNVLAMERDQQDGEASDVALIRLLKNREFGDVGECDQITYNKETGRLLEAPYFDDETSSPTPGGSSANHTDLPF
jgi:twinkle protein